MRESAVPAVGTVRSSCRLLPPLDPCFRGSTWRMLLMSQLIKINIVIHLLSVYSYVQFFEGPPDALYLKFYYRYRPAPIRTGISTKRKS